MRSRFLPLVALACLLGLPTTASALGKTAPTPLSSSLTRARAIEETTGLHNGSEVAAKRACRKPSRAHASCLAQVLINKKTKKLIHPNLHRAGAFVVPRGTSRGVTVAGSSEPPAPGTPAYLQQAYDLGGLSATAGAGDTVAIVDAYDSETAEADLQTFRAAYGLPACTTANGCFSKVNQDGHTTPLPENEREWAVEISLDLDAVSSLCPHCHILLVEANSASFADLVTAEHEAYTLGAKQISNSWGGEGEGSPSEEGISDGQFSFAGVATLAASGDAGYGGPASNQYPASLPGVTSIGGTSLEEPSSSGVSSTRGVGESVWGNSIWGTGSGCNTQIPQPSWQTGIGCAGRAYNDIAADADPYTGLNIYDSQEEGWEVVGGTSEATPLTAAYYALLGGVGGGNASWDYSHASLLNDILSGSDNTYLFSCDTFICNGAVGYDGPSGNGSISGAALAGPPGVAGPSQTNGGYVSAADTSSVTLSGGVYPNQMATKYWWEYGPTTAYGSTTTPTDVGDGANAPAGSGGLVPVSSTVTGLTAGETYHYRLVAQNNYHGEETTTYGYDYSFAFSGASSTTPTVSNVSASKVEPTSVEFSGTVNPNGGETTYYFEYGNSAAYGSETPLEEAGSGTSPVNVTAAVGELEPNTTYHYTLVAVNALGERTLAADQTFLTPPAGGSVGGGAPLITNLAALNLSATGATVSASINPNGDGLVYLVAYGKSSEYENIAVVGQLSAGTEPVPISTAITGLEAKTTYHFAVEALNEEGEETVSPDQTFETLEAGSQPKGTTPSLSDVSASGITETTATLQGVVNPDGADTTYSFSYGTEVSYGSATTPVDIGVGTSNVTETISGLTPNTVYHYTLVASNAFGQTTYTDQTLQTLGSPPTPEQPAPGGPEESPPVAPEHKSSQLPENPPVGPVGRVEAGLTLTQQAAPVKAGHKGSVTLTVSNTSKALATGVIVCDTLPHQAKYLRASRASKRRGAEVCFAIGNLPRGAQAKTTLFFSVAHGTRHGFTNHATAAAKNATTTALQAKIKTP